ncbi:MAG: zinc ribbon domain-containing protein, partial [Bacteroidota bacterium]
VHLLSGFLTCYCGRKMYVYHEAPTYACKKCRNRIAVADIDEIFHTQLKTFLLTDTDMETFLKQSDSMIQERQTLLTLAQQELATGKKKLGEQIDLRICGELTAERFKEFYWPLEERLSQLEKQIPELEAEIDFLRIQYLSSDTVLREAKDLYERWPQLPFEEKRSIAELITEQIIIGKEDISIKLSYLPHAPSFQKSGKSQQNFMDSSKQST